MSASTDPPRPAGAAAGAWRPAGLLYLGMLLAGLAAGLWPEAVFPTRQSPRPAPLPTLQTLAVAQGAFILLIYPLVLLLRARRRAASGASLSYWRPVLAESMVFLAISVPFYIPAAFLADAVSADGVRTGLHVASLLPVAWAAGAHFARRRAGDWAVLLALVVVALGLPAGAYIALEFFRPGPGRVLSLLAPGLLAWRTAAARQPALLPQPVWAWLIWPGAAAIGLLGHLFARPRRGPGA